MERVMTLERAPSLSLAAIHFRGLLQPGGPTVRRLWPVHFRVDIVVGSNRNQCHFERHSASHAPEIIIVLALCLSTSFLLELELRVSTNFQTFVALAYIFRDEFVRAYPLLAERPRALISQIRSRVNGGRVSTLQHRREEKRKKEREEEWTGQLPLILSLNRRIDASAAIQCETIKISRSGAELGTPCHKFQQILIILSGVTRPRTFPTEFQAIAPRSCACIGPVAASASEQEIQKSSSGVVKSDHSRSLFVASVCSCVLPPSPLLLSPLGSSLPVASLSRGCSLVQSVIPSLLACAAFVC